MSNDTYFSRNTKFLVEPIDGFTGLPEVKVLGKNTAAADTTTIAADGSGVSDDALVVLAEIPASNTTFAGLQTLSGITDDSFIFRALDGSAMATGNTRTTGGTAGLATCFKKTGGDVSACQGTKVSSGEARVYEIPILEGYSFSQTMDTQDVSISEAVGASSESRRGRKVFNNSRQPAEFSFQTYIRPYHPNATASINDATSASFLHPKGGGTYSNDPVVSLVELPLWQMLNSEAKNQSAHAVFGGGSHGFAGNQAAGGPYGKQPVLNLHYSSDPDGGDAAHLGNKVKKANIYFVVEDNASFGGETIEYKLTDAVINEATIDFDIEGIATVTWSGFASSISEETSAPTATVFEAVNSTSNFIVNKLTNCMAARTWKGQVTDTDGSTPRTKLIDGTQNFRTDDLIGGFVKNFGTSKTASTGGGTHGTISDNDGTSVTIGANLSQTVTFAASAASASTQTLVYVYDDSISDIRNAAQDKLRRFVTPGMDVAFGTSATEGVAESSSNDNNAVVSTSVGSQFVPMGSRLRTSAAVTVGGNVGTGITLTGPGGATDTFAAGDFYEINKDYFLSLIGGSITISNNITYLTPDTLGTVDVPFEAIKGTRSVSGSVSCYLNDDGDDTFDSASFFASMQEDQTSKENNINNRGSMRITLGDSPTTHTQVNLKTDFPDHTSMIFDLFDVSYGMPTLSSDDTISFNLEFNANSGETFQEMDDISITVTTGDGSDTAPADIGAAPRNANQIRG